MFTISIIIKTIHIKFEMTEGMECSAITAAGVVPCGGPKKSPRTSYKVQIIFSFGPLKSARVL